MNEQNKKVPTVRFKGFTNDWEQHKLGEISFKVNTKNKENLTLPVLSNSAEYGIVNQEDYFDKKIANRTDNYYIVKHNDFVYNPRISKKAPYGPIRRNTLDTKGLMSPLYYVFRINDGNYIYLDYYFKSSKWYKFMYQNGDSGARSDRFAIQDKIFQMMPISMPNTKEQNKIGQLIQTLQKLIDLQQRKLALLKQLKKGMLQKMFAEKNSKRPILRFKGFHDDWEQRKLGTYIIEYKKKTTKNNEYPVLTSSRKGIFFQKDYYDGHQVASKDNVGYNIVPYGYFTYRHMSDDNLFNFNINTLCKFGIVSTLYPVFTLNTSADKYFVYYYLNYGKEMQKFALIQKQGGSRTYMYLNKLRKLRFIVPLLSEQEKISTTLLLLDKLISLQHQKLAKYQSVKKSLLQQMFI